MASDGLDVDLRSSPDGMKHVPPPPSTAAGTVGAFLKDVIVSWGPAILLVFVIRSILIEPFQIPSGSMVPTLEVGDFIMVSKLTYGLRVPFTNVEILPLGEPERGDIVVFIYPPTQDTDPVDYIKRIVGLPGDEVEVRDDVVYVNGQIQPRTFERTTAYTNDACQTAQMKQYAEILGGLPHPVLQNTDFQRMANWGPQKVPDGHYFVMGDNRDNSADSRVWGFVPRQNIKGKAMFVWLSFDGCRPGVPVLGEVRLSRVGTGLN